MGMGMGFVGGVESFEYVRGVLRGGIGGVL